MTEHDLPEDWLADVREQIEIDVIRERRAVVPDFAATVALAHARDPEGIPSAWVREVEALAPVVDLRGRDSGEAEIDDRRLDALIGEARQLIEQDVAARRLAAIPPLPRAAPLPHSRARWLIPLIAIAAVSTGLALAVPRMLDRLASTHGEGAPSHQSEFQEREPVNERTLPSQAATSTAITGEAEVRSVEPMPVDPIPIEPPITASDAAKVEPEPSASKPSLADRIARLDDEAQRMWAEGDLEGASEAFQAIVELAGRGRHADLAYGDLFTLAHQRGDQDTEEKLWREYLERFPKGRFADDARAGSCRRSKEPRACWSDYLDDFPTGVHRPAAERALEDSP